MCVQNAMHLRVYPFEACVKVDDTLPGIDEGLNAGMWTIGLARTGNELGLNAEEIARLEPGVLQARLEARPHAPASIRRSLCCGRHLGRSRRSGRHQRTAGAR